MTPLPLPLRMALRVLPLDVRREVAGELLDAYLRRRSTHGRAAATRWAWRQPVIALIARGRWRTGTPAFAGAAGGPMFDLKSDLLFAVRASMRRPGVTAVVVLTIAISVSALAAISGVIDATWLRPLPYPDASQIVWVRNFSVTSGSGESWPWANPQDVVDWRERSKSFAAIAAIEQFETTVQAGQVPVRVKAASVNATIGTVLGIHAALGRLFTDDDYATGTHSVVLTDALWRSAFGGDPSMVGGPITIDGERYTAVGVLPPTTRGFPEAATDLWFPLKVPARSAAEGQRGGVWQHVVARIKPGVSFDEANADIGTVAANLRQEFPKTNKTRGVALMPLRDGIVGESRGVLTLLAVAVSLVLLIACANVGHLLLVGAQARRREFAVRLALGATGPRLARLMLAESAVLSIAGGGLGLLMAPLALTGFIALYPEPLPAIGPVAISRTAVLVAFGAIVVSSLAGVLPSLLSARVRSLAAAMRATDRGSDSPAQRRIRTALVLAQVALSTVLLVGGLLLARTFLSSRNTDLGFSPDGVLSFNVALANTRYPALDDEARFYRELSDRLRALPGVTAVGASSLLPLAEGEFKDGFIREGTADAFPNLPIGRLQNVSPGFFEALGLPLKAGRAIDARDSEHAPDVAMINETMERKYFPAGAVGKRIRFRGHSIEIIGVVGDKRQHGRLEEPWPDFYLPQAQSGNPRLFGWVLVRTSADPGALANAVRAAVRDVDPTVAVAGVATMNQRVGEVLAPDRFRAVLIGTLSAVALLLAAIGIYGLISYSVALDARDTAIRVALGATSRHTVGRLLARVIGLAALGVGAGLLAALWFGRLLTAYLFGVTANDPETLATVAALLIAVAIVAAAGPALKTGRIDPIDTLRST